MDDDNIDTLICTFLWADKYKGKQDQIDKIYESALQILCDLINIKSGKYFIPTGLTQDIDRIKKRAINHGVLALLIHIFEHPDTDFVTKRLINTKIIGFSEPQDLTDQLEIIKEGLDSSEKENQHFTPTKEAKTSSTPNKLDMGSNLAITGSSIKGTSPRQTTEIELKEGLNTKMKQELNLDNLKDLVQKQFESLENKQQKVKEEEELKKKKLEEAKANKARMGINVDLYVIEKDDKRAKAKRGDSIPFNFLFIWYRKAPCPLFSKDENKQDENTEEGDGLDAEIKDKYKPLKEDPNYIKMKINQEKAEGSLKQWKKVSGKINLSLAKNEGAQENNFKKSIKENKRTFKGQVSCNLLIYLGKHLASIRIPRQVKELLCTKLEKQLCSNRGPSIGLIS